MSSTGEIAKLRRRRGVAKGSITRIETRLATLEGTPDQPNILDSARQMLAKLKEHDADFRKIHLAIIDLTEDEDPALPDEQAVLDEHDDLVATLTMRIMARLVTYHANLASHDDILRRFWEIEDSQISLSPEERATVQHFELNHSRASSGRFVVSLPKRKNIRSLGESRSQVVNRFLSLERTLHAKGQFNDLSTVMQEYFDLGMQSLSLLEICMPRRHKCFIYPFTPCTSSPALLRKYGPCLTRPYHFRFSIKS